MRVSPYIVLFAALSLAVLSSCAKAWRGDGPPKLLSGTVWEGTNQARNEVLLFSFSDGTVVPEGENTREDGSVTMDYLVGDTVKNRYEGSYTYYRIILHNGTGSVSADAFLTVVEVNTGDTLSFKMGFSNQRFFTNVFNSYYPTDPVTE
ncbi:MAG TPA: hypothetical protein IAC04_00685 [Candidatus Coprenecus stercoravium]|uniref:Lipoprotein n=1 Tax=Candidatus Coprenecus stercoravium TaxID=2840735 RepID=A0A9D2K8N4_9BACT|nr:hypothetical protein [Candidatus Coprenecus stercoravium]